MICEGYRNTNNTFIKLHNFRNPSTYITYLDYFFRHSMMQRLPIELLDWVNPKKFNLDNYSNNGPKGCFLQVHRGYPEELHDLHNDYPLAPEKKCYLNIICKS